MLSPLTYWILLLAVAAFAFHWGKVDERMAAAICIVATIATKLVHTPLSSRFTHVEVGVMLVDLATLAGFPSSPSGPTASGHCGLPGFS